MRSVIPAGEAEEGRLEDCSETVVSEDGFIRVLYLHDAGGRECYAFHALVRVRVPATFMSHVVLLLVYRPAGSAVAHCPQCSLPGARATPGRPSSRAAQVIACVFVATDPAVANAAVCCSCYGRPGCGGSVARGKLVEGVDAQRRVLDGAARLRVRERCPHEVCRYGGVVQPYTWL